MTPVRNNCKEGFTLIEVMLAMTLLSIMMLLLFTSLKIGAESWDKGEAKIAEVNEKAVVYHFFKRHLPTIRPLWDDFSDDERMFSFQGSRDKLQFVSVFPASSGRKGMQLFEVLFDRSENGAIKVVLVPFYPALNEQAWKPEEEILLDKVDEFKISYFALGEQAGSGSWEHSWIDKETLPGLIKIKITLLDQSYWPEMIFALKLTRQHDQLGLDEDEDNAIEEKDINEILINEGLEDV